MRVGRGTGLAVLALGFLAAALAGWLHVRRIPDLERWDDRIRATAGELGLDAELLRAVVAAESGGDPDAVSASGAVGLCQLMPETAAEEADRLGLAGYTRARLADPALNLRLGASYLVRLLRRFEGEEAFALAAYNAGATRVLRWRRRAPDVAAIDVIRREGYAETRAYVERVLRFRAAYAAE